MALAAHNSAIYSSLGADPDLGELVALFVEEMPERISRLQQALTKGDREDLYHAAHQLKGAAGSYGFGQLTPLAAAVERAARDNEPEGALRKALQELISLCQQVRAGMPSHPGTPARR
jgi:HPt (histidine-containing phosphotransfer) domain-containing protein